MRITWLSNAPWASTGYGNQTRMFTPRIKAMGHDVGIIAFYGLDGGILNWGGMPVYPKAYHPYGNDIFSAHSVNFDADIMISLMDIWVLDPAQVRGKLKWVPWFPIDHSPLPRAIREPASKAHKRITFSRFGERMLHDADLDCYYVPHGIDTNVFRPLDMVESRDFLRWPTDKFIVGMVAANKGNPSRKSFTQLLQAWALFAKRHDDAMLYLHTGGGTAGENGGVNLPELIDALGIQSSVIFCDQYVNIVGYPDGHMAQAYSGMDVHILPSMGEGFGIPTVEAQACGCPVIVGDWTASSELCFSGWKIPKELTEDYWTPLAAYQQYPRVEGILQALEASYRMRGNQDYRKRARDGALAYDADKVTEKYWRPVLADIEANL